MASRPACRSPTFGSACACISTRWSRHNATASPPASSISGVDIGLPSGAIGRPLSTIIDVSLLRNTSSMKWLIEKQTRWSLSPHPRCGKPIQKSRPWLVAGFTRYSRKWPCTSNTNSLPASAARAASGSVDAVGGMANVPPGLRPFVARIASSEHAFNARSVVAAPHTDMRNERRDTPSERALRSQSSRARRIVSSTTARARHRVVLAVRARPELDRQTWIFLTPAAHRSHGSDGAPRA